MGLVSALATPPAPATPVGVGIDHKAVGCIVAEEYPRLDACFAPSEAVGRAQIQFRASEKSPWYAVDMKPEGACFSTFLPKPRKETTSIEYFVFAIDKQFAESRRPEKAPGEPYTPRVVPKKSDCEDTKALVAWSAKTAPRILVNLVRDAGGRVLEAAAAGQAAVTPTGISGFSSDGVVVANGSTAHTPSSPSASAAAGKKGHFPTLAVLGGLAVAGGAVALAAGGGDSGGGSGSGSGSSGSGGSGSGGTGGSNSPATNPLSGVWSGSAPSAGYSLKLILGRNLGQCLWTADVSVNFTQNGNSLTGPATFSPHPVSCTPGGLVTNVRDLAPAPAEVLNATLAPPNGISMATSWVPVTGTYDAATINMRGTQPLGEDTMEATFIVTKRAN